MTSAPSSPSSVGLLGRGARRPPQRRPHPRQQDLRAERLGHVIVGPEVQAADDVRLLPFGGEHDDRHGLGPRIVPQSLADGQSVDAGQHQVQEDQIGRSRLGGGQGLLARRHARHLVAFLQQMVADQLPDVLLILDDEHGFFDHSTSTRGRFQQSRMSHGPCAPTVPTNYRNRLMLAEC